MAKPQTDGRKKPKKDAPASASGTRPGSKSGLKPMGKAEYLEQLAPLELELDILARWLQHTGRRLMVLLDTCRVPAKWCCSTAAGTTAPASRP
jgi:hypothetical protein